MEFEKKYLITTLPSNLENYPQDIIVQSYISIKPTIRIRKKADLYFLTIKGAGHIAREEFELMINQNEYDFLMTKADYTLEKTRYYIPIGPWTGELDIYHNGLKGLYTVEVEFPSIEELTAFQPPNWFGIDISMNEAYKNTSLAKYGKPTAI